MNDLVATLGKDLLWNNIEKIAKGIWIPKETTAQAMKIALPALMKQMANNTKTDSWAEQLFEALRGHDWSALSKVEQIAKAPEKTDANSILKHILWSQQSEVEKEIAQQTSIDSSEANKLLWALAPLLMGSLWKAQDNGMDITKMISGLSSLGGWKSNLLTSMLDKNGNGDIKDDLMKMWLNVLKSKFFKK